MLSEISTLQSICFYKRSSATKSSFNVKIKISPSKFGILELYLSKNMPAFT